MTTIKTTTARKTGDKTATVTNRPRVTKRDKRIMEAWRDQANTTDAAFFRDEQYVQTAAQYFTLEESLIMLDKGELPLPSSWGTRFFDAQLLPIAIKASHRRDELLTPHVEQLERLLPEILEGYNVTPAGVRVTTARLRERLDLYSGPPQSEPYIAWAIEQVAATITALRIIRTVERENSAVFADVYQRAYRSAWAGVLEILKNCHHLGATHEVAEELVHITFTKVFIHIEDWYDDGEASIPTRIHAYARDQALGWRTERVREKQRRGRLLGGVRRRRRELLYPTGAKKPSADVQLETEGNTADNTEPHTGQPSAVPRSVPSIE